MNHRSKELQDMMKDYLAKGGKVKKMNNFVYVEYDTQTVKRKLRGLVEEAGIIHAGNIYRK